MEGQKKTNIFAIIGLILSIIGGFVVSAIGFVLCIVGLVKVKDYHSGKGLSIAGIVVCVIKVLFILLAILAIRSLADNEEFNKNMCDALVSYKDDKEVCTKKDDGSYECDFKIAKITCKFDNEKVENENVVSEKKELGKIMLNYFNKNAKTNKDTLKLVVDEAKATGEYEDKADMIVYEVEYTFECTDSSTSCISNDASLRDFPGLPIEYGKSATDVKITFTDGKVKGKSTIVYSKKSDTLEWSTSATSEVKNFDKAIELR